MRIVVKKFHLIRENRFYGGNFIFLAGKVVKGQEKHFYGEKSIFMVGKSQKCQEKHFYGRKNEIMDIFLNKIDITT